MLTLPNGKKLDFLCASGALGFTGHGYWFERPFFWMRWIRPEEFTIITKTLTYEPRKGNYRWWKPWQTFRPFKKGTVNCLGLPNPGYKAWIKSYYPKSPYELIPSIAPTSEHEAKEMAADLSPLKLTAIEVNVSCPNVSKIDAAVSVVETVVKHSSHPVIVKLGVNYMEICRALDGKVAAFNVINAIPWDLVFPGEHSPLSCGGAVSGDYIKEYARTAVYKIRRACVTPIISGGGLDSIDEVKMRSVMGARAFAFGTIFLRHPSLPNKIAKAWREGER